MIGIKVLDFRFVFIMMKLWLICIIFVEIILLVFILDLVIDFLNRVVKDLLVWDIKNRYL